jgi:type I restriction-modification system DNA methylase subunit
LPLKQRGEQKNDRNAKTLHERQSAVHQYNSAWQAFVDFAEAAAISISNAVDWPQRDKREERYMEIVKRYKPDELAAFPKMLAELTLALEGEPSDVMGRTFHDLELHNKWAGQFFSPFPLCRMMAKMTLGDDEGLRAKIAERGFVTAQEPACGSGAMVIALAQEMKDAGINYQQHLHVTAVDVDAKCVHMNYLQFALLHIPAVIIHGNTLSLEEFGRWYTPAHIMGGWNWKLRRELGLSPGLRQPVKRQFTVR